MSGIALLRAAAAAAAVLLGATGVRAAMHRSSPLDVPVPALALDVPVPVPVPVPALSLSPRSVTGTVTGTGERAFGNELQIGAARAALAPLDTDAPGTDSATAGRPLRATRLLDTAVDTNGSRLRVYATLAPATALEPALARSIVGRGFARRTSVDPSTLTFARDSELVILRFAHRDERTIVSIIELGFRSTEDAR